MILILRKQENMLKNYAEIQQNQLNNGEKTMRETNQLVLQRMCQVETLLQKEVKTMAENVERMIAKSIDNFTKEALIFWWADALKYGIATAFCFIPIFLIIRFILGLMNIKL